MAAAAEVVRSFEIPETIPPGNWLAHQLRLINMQSEGLIPESAGSKRSYDKYNTVTHKDFIPPREGFVLEEPKLEQEPFQKKRETVADIMLAPHPRQLFLNWNVPNRYVPGQDEGTLEHYDPPLHLKPEDETKLETIREDVKEIPTSPVRSPVKAPSPIKSARYHKSQAPEMVPRQMSLPELRLRSADRQKGGLTRQYTKLPDMTGQMAQPAVPKIARSKTELGAKPPIPSPRRSLTNLQPADLKQVHNIREELQQSLQPQVVDKAEQWMKLAPQADRKVIERVLRLAEKRQQQNASLTKALQPNAKEAVEKWLSDANEDERQVALRFFNSVAGEKLMGMTHAEQKKRLQQVIHALESEDEDETLPNLPRGKGSGPYTDPNKFKVKRALGEPRASYSKFNHLRLLSPGTRRDRWMHTTWHHLPEYRTDNIVKNISSHYTAPQAIIPRHFVIHPDWG